MNDPKPTRSRRGGGKPKGDPYGRPALRPQTTTLWEYASQDYGDTPHGTPGYEGATPAWVIWDLLSRYTREGDTIVDPMVGGGTTIDVAKELGREVRGFDISPTRPDVEQADARKLPLEKASADFVFVDPPYSTHINYSEAPDCIGKLDANSEAYYRAMEQVIGEIDRVLKPRRFLALYVSDSFRKGEPFMPIGFELFALLRQRFQPIDIVSVVRGNRKLKKPHWHKEAVKGNYLLRGFNYLFIMKKA
jgi:adenine-specific DNA-methyltransferase